MPRFLLACSILLAACSGSTRDVAPASPPTPPPRVRVLLVAQERESMFQPSPAVSAWLGQERIRVSSHRSLEDLTPALLRPYQVVVLHQHRLAPSLTPAVRRGLAALRDHAAAGGGLLVTKDLYSRRGAAFYQALLGPLGAEVLQEQLVEQGPGFTYRLKSLGSTANLFAWTDALTAGHPVVQGVRGLYYSVGRWEPGEPGSLPLKVSRAWTVLVRGRPTAVSLASRPTGFHPTADSVGPGTYSASPPLLAVRQLKKGRVAVWPTLASFTLLDGFSPVLEGGLVMRSTHKGRPSDGARLLANLIRWLAPRTPPAGPVAAEQRPVAARISTVKPLTWGRRVGSIPASGAQAFRGLIGAYSTLSGGRATPEELMAAARSAGYDFIAFAEDLSVLTREGWDRLVRLCRAGSDARFRAVPGLRYRGADGDPFIALGDVGYPPAAWADPHVPGKKIASNTTLRMALNPVPAIIHLPLPGNRRPARLHAAFSGQALEVWRGDQRLARDLDGYLALQREGLGLFATAVHLVDGADQVAAAAHGPGLQAWIRADSLDELLDGVQGLRGARGRYHRPAFASSGPEVLAFSAANWGTSDLARPGRHRFRLKLSVRSSIGLQEVHVLDGGRTWRRFLPRGARAFSTMVDGNHDRQHAFVLKVTDTRGGQAVSWARNTAAQELSYGTSTDNLNDLGPMGKASLDRGLIRLRGTEQAMRLISPGVFRRLAALVALDPGTGQRLGVSGRHASMQRSLLVGRFGAITEHSLDHLWNGPGMPGVAHATPVLANPLYGGVLRRTRPARLPPGPELEVREVELRLRRPVRLLQTPGVVLASSANWGLRKGELDHVLLPDGQGGLRRWTPAAAEGPRTRVVELRPGAFVAAYPQPTALFALDRPLQALVRRQAGPGGATLIQVGLGRKGETLPAGAVLRARLGLLTLPRATLGSYPWLPAHRSLWRGAGLMEQVHAGLGLSGPPGFLIQPTVGRVVGTGLLLRLAAHGGAFSARVSKSELPLPVPLLLSGLNPGWSAVLLYRGENQILTVEWPPGWFRGAPSHRRFVRLRGYQDPFYPVGVSEEGLALAQLDLHNADRDIFLGHPVTCDRPDFKLTLVYDEARQEAEVEVHNPTDRSARVQVRPGKGFQLFGDFTREVKVDSGASVVFKLQKTGR